MPLFCSNKPIVVLSSVLSTIILFIIFFASSNYLLKQYDDPSMFKPNSQDYFRTALLGLFSPFLYFFIKVFILNLNTQKIMLNLFVDFFLNDWYILCILISLAYPQIQEQQNHKHEIDHQSVWHIIPRQSYIFGISWSLGEFLLSIVCDIFNYQEIPRNDKLIERHLNFLHGQDESNTTKDSDTMDKSFDRGDITLSKCINLRRVSSSISSNVYSNLDDSIFNRTYGSIRSIVEDSEATPKNNDNMDKNNNDNDNNNSNSNNSNSNNIPKNKGNIQENSTTKTQPDSDILMVDPIDNSLKLAPVGIDLSSYHRTIEPDPIFDANHGYTWVTYENLENQISPKIKLYCEIDSDRKLLFKIMKMIALVAGNIFLTVGESLLLSIYFVYVPEHEHLFSKVVNYFGKRDINNFLFRVVLPFSLLNFLVSVVTFLCNDIDESLFKTSDISGNTSAIERFYSFLYDRGEEHSTHSSETEPLLLENGTLDISMSHISTTLLTDSMMYYTKEEHNSMKSKIFTILKSTLRPWKAVARKDWFILSAVCSWGLTIFVTGLLCTVILY